MVTVKYKLGKKKLGNWRLPVEYFYAEFTPPELDVRPYVSLWKKYSFPVNIYIGRNLALEKSGDDCYCERIHKDSDYTLQINLYVDKQDTPKRVDILKKIVKCFKDCEGCKKFIDFYPGAPSVEQLFQQIANDIINAYNEAVENAYKNEETEEKEFCVSNESKIDIIQQQEKAKPVRKINI